MICWLLHRHLWMTLIPGILPFKIDGVHYCRLCDKGGKGQTIYVTPSGGAWVW